MSETELKGRLDLPPDVKPQYVTVERYRRLVEHVKLLTANYNALAERMEHLTTRQEYIDHQWDLIQGVNEAMKRGESFKFQQDREKRDRARQYANAEKKTEAGA